MTVRDIFSSYYGTNTVTKIYYLKGSCIMNEKVEKYMEAYKDAVKSMAHTIVENGDYDELDSTAFDALQKFMALMNASNELIAYQARTIDEINEKLNRVLEEIK